MVARPAPSGPKFDDFLALSKVVWFHKIGFNWQWKGDKKHLINLTYNLELLLFGSHLPPLDD